MPSFLDPAHLWAFLMNVLRLSAWLVFLSVIFVPLERLYALHPQKTVQQSAAQDVGFYFLSGLLPALLLVLPLSLVAAAAHALVPHGFQDMVASWPLWMRIVVGLVVGEVGFYWGHRWAHEIPWLWRFHAVHHHPTSIYFLISARAHPIDMVFIRLCGLIPAYILGVASPLTPNGSVVPALIILVATTWGFFIHANVRWRLGPLEWLVATPAFHHWHHTLDDPRDRNYASMLPWMDRIFGTHYLPPDQWPRAYGIEDALPATMAGQLMYPLRLQPQPISQPIQRKTTDA